MQLELTSTLAQAIVDKVMETIPYNINIMNKDGIIIASGHTNRIGTIHNGAVESIRINHITEIYQNTPTEKVGVNIPFYFQSTLVGVIGISGDPDTVRPFARLVSITAEFMINQQYTLSLEGQRELQLNTFLHDLANHYFEIDNPFFAERAGALNFNLNTKRVCVAIKLNRVSNQIISAVSNYAFADEYILRYRTDHLVGFFVNNAKLQSRLTHIISQFKEIEQIGIGRQSQVMAQSVQEAIRATEIGLLLESKTKILRYQDYILPDILLKNPKSTYLMEPILKIIEYTKNSDLLDTFLSYVEFNGEISSISNNLHIHRNTLYYRLSKIQEITGKDPTNFFDLNELIVSYYAYKLQAQTLIE